MTRILLSPFISYHLISSPASKIFDILIFMPFRIFCVVASQPYALFFSLFHLFTHCNRSQFYLHDIQNIRTYYYYNHRILFFLKLIRLIVLISMQYNKTQSRKNEEISKENIKIWWNHCKALHELSDNIRWFQNAYFFSSWPRYSRAAIIEHYKGIALHWVRSSFTDSARIKIHETDTIQRIVYEKRCGFLACRPFSVHNCPVRLSRINCRIESHAFQ